MMKIIDAHTHVQFEQYDRDCEEVIRRALNERIGMINAGADLKSSVAAVELAHLHEGLWATVGIHPTEVHRFADMESEEFEAIARDPKVVGIGECGMDLYREEDRKKLEEQKKLFERHVSLAHRVKKPLVIHCRQAFNETFDLLVAHRRSLLPNAGIFHFFTGNIEQADTAMGLGFSFTFGGLITFSREFDGVIKHVPMERILVETDAPFVAPKSHRGQRNEPSYVTEVIQAVAGIKNIDEEKVQRQVLENTKRVFDIK